MTIIVILYGAETAAFKWSTKLVVRNDVLVVDFSFFKFYGCLFLFVFSFTFFLTVIVSVFISFCMHIFVFI